MESDKMTFEAEYETSVYLGASGHLVITQNDGQNNIETVIIKEKKRAYQIIRAMKLVLQDDFYGISDKEAEEL
jgi:hypothetical protein